MDPNPEPYPKVDPRVYAKVSIVSRSPEEPQNNKIHPAQETYSQTKSS